MSNGQQSGLACDKCGSSDARTRYPKGDSFCFSCETYFPPDGLPWEEEAPKVKSTGPVETGEYPNQPVRGLRPETLTAYGVKVGYNLVNGEVSDLHFPVYREGGHVGTKIKKLSTKEIFAKGSCKNPDFFGADKAGSGGKLLVITEGEEDCMTAHQLLADVGKAYKVVSLPSGANTRAVKERLEWLESFETIILNLDSDEPGRKCATEIAELLTPGKVKVMSLPSNMKDNNQWLTEGKATGQDYLRRLNNAKEYRPDGIIVTSMSNILNQLEQSDATGPSVPYPWSGLNEKLYGMREREIVTWTAGTGIGKSAVMREIEHHLLQTTEDNVGVLALEESVDRSMWGVLAVEANLPLAIKEERIKRGIEAGSQQVKDWIKASKMENRMQILDHWGSTGERNLLNKVRFMIRGLGCKYIILDHLAIVVSGMDVREDERKTIDRIMTQLRQLTEETGASLHLVAHLRRIEGGRSHEQGMEVGLSHLRGSQAIAQLSDAVVAMERNQQADDEKEANLTRLRVLKNRYAGITGMAANLAYDRATGRLAEIFNVDVYLSPSEEEAGC